MKKELKRNQKITYTVIYLLMVFSLANVLSSLLFIDLNIVGKFFIVILIGLIIQLFVLNPISLIPALGALVGTILLYNKYNREALMNVLLWIEQFYENISNHFRGTEEILFKNSTALWIIFVVLLSLYTIIIIFKTRNNYLLLPVYLLFFIYYWYIYIDISYLMMALFLMLYIVLLGCDGYFNSQKDWVKKRVDSTLKIYPYWFKTAIRYGLVIIVLAGILPKGGAVVDWNWLERQAQDMFPFLLDFRDDLVYSRSYGQADLFDFSQTGFQSNNNKLGGPVILSERLVMKVKAPYPLYLRGNVKSIYIYNHWRKGSVDERTYNTKVGIPLEVVYGSRITLEITHENLATKTIFSPYQPFKVNISDVNRMTVDRNYQINLLGAKYKGEGYEVKANIPSRLVDFNQEESLENYSDYLQLPLDLSEAVYKLGDNITKGADTPYEKAILIRNYLRENYQYTLEPKHTPFGKDFVEYFLMEQKEGYCTYFATAMAILLRTQGIPSRYVEGFMMPNESKNGIYEVRQYNAHAWVEAYLGGGSWITFEPTPAFQIPEFQDIEIDGEEISFNIRNPIDDMNELDQNGSIGNNLTDDLLTVESDVNIDKSSIQPIQNSLSIAWDFLSRALGFMLIFVLLGIIPIRVGYIYFKIRKYHKNLRLSKKSNIVLYLYQNILQLLNQLDYGIQQGETAYEYANRITNKIYDYEHDFRKLTDIYIKSKYGQIKISQKEMELIFDFFKFIELKVRNKKGLLKYHFNKYVQGKLFYCYKVSDETIPYL